MLSQIGLAMFLQVFLSSSRAANIVGYLVAIWTNLIGATLSVALYQFPRPLALGWSFWPTFSFNRIFYLLFSYCSNDQCLKSFSDLTPDMWWYISVLYGSFVVFALVGMYLFEVVPQEFGVSQPVLFPLYYIRDKFRKQKNEVGGGGDIEEHGGSDDTLEEEREKIREI